MELEEVYIIRFHRAQAVFDVCKHAIFIGGGALGRKNDFVSYIRECETDLALTVRIGVRSVKKIDAAFISCAQNIHSAVLAASLDRQTAHCGLGHHQAGLSKTDFLHGFILRESVE